MSVLQKLINHRKKSLHLLKLKSLSEKVYCKLQINMSYMLTDLKKIHALMFKYSNLFIYLNLQIDIYL